MYNLSINETFFNKTRVAEDGVTHIIDSETKYKMYAINLTMYYKEDEKINIDKDLEQIKIKIMEGLK